VRFVLAEKGINVEIVDVEEDASAAEDLAELTPYNETPTLVDRDLVLYDAGVINEYLDERYPHPPLMPVDPVSRAGLRKVHYRVLRDWYPLWRDFQAASGKKAAGIGKQLTESVAAANELFERAEFVLSEELTLVDCTLAPLFWRLQAGGLLPRKGAPDALKYAERLFSRASFNASLTNAERDLIRNAA
jgi:RNA polymerase-associated protein